MNPYDILPKILINEQIDLYGWTLLQQPLSLALYSDWLDENNQGSMDYLKRHKNQKAMTPNSERLARSAIVIGIPYLPEHPTLWVQDPISNLRRASYSKGIDYHIWFSKKLKSIVNQLTQYFPDESFETWVDSGPVLERDLAYRSGLGWIGKNTCLISRAPKKTKGSFLLLGEIYTSLIIENNQALSADFCGTCTKCIEACPTKAIKPNRKLIATQCISYWTMESKEIPPVALRKAFQDWIFGCDICQNVCPWNASIFKNLKQQTHPENIQNELRWILQSSNKTILKALATSALERASGYKLKRNALIVIGNLKLINLKKEVQLFLNDTRLSELASWCLNEIDPIS